MKFIESGGQTAVGPADWFTGTVRMMRHIAIQEKPDGMAWTGWRR